MKPRKTIHNFIVHEMHMCKCYLFCSSRHPLVGTSIYRMQESMRNCQLCTVAEHVSTHHMGKITRIPILRYRNCHQLSNELSGQKGSVTYGLGADISLSLSACRQVSETWLTKAITGPKSRGAQFGTTLRRHAQRYCSFGILLTHAKFPQNWSSYHIRGETIFAYRSNTVFISANFFNMSVKF